MAASIASNIVICLLLLVTMMSSVTVNGGIVGFSTWCVARSDASTEALQTALDYACGAGADCLSLQPDGLCFLPNTIQAHASYAFNAYYQSKARAPGSCDFSGTATIAQTDPSYGSCVYPSSATASASGGPNTPSITSPMNNPNVPPSTTTAPIFGGGNAGGLTPGMSTLPDTSRAPSEEMATCFSVFLSSLLAVTIVIIIL